MLQIKSVWQDDDHFYIYRDDGVIAVQRKYVFDATHNPLTSDEETINAMCRKLLPPITTGRE